MSQEKNSDSKKPLAADTVCKKCGSKKLKVDFGFNYHFHCLACKNKTNIRNLKCQGCGGPAKLKKRGQEFYVFCKSCNQEDLFFTNVPSRGRMSKDDKEAAKAKRAEMLNPCPKCGREMRERTIQKGANAGKKYMGCSGYPKCKHKEPIEF